MLKNNRQMSVHLHNALRKVEQDILALANMAEAQLHLAIKALVSLDPETARQLVQRDIEIDEKEVAIEEECLKILALYQPVAHDLRFVIAALKMTNDLERIGDYAVQIAKRTVSMSEARDIEPVVDFSTMADKACKMLRLSIEALINQDVEKAREIWRADDEVDALHKKSYELVESRIRNHPDQVRHLIQFISVSKYLERVADLATNIADDVVYMVEGILPHYQRKGVK